MTYEDNILAVYERATPEQREAGREWYDNAGHIVWRLAEWAEVPAHTFARTLAILSPRNPWRWNVQDAAAFAFAASQGLPQPTATTMKSFASRAWDCLHGECSWGGPKIKAFVDAITGDTHAVVVDSWAAKVAGRLNGHVNPKQYAEVAAAYRAVAREVRETPRDLQAITWLVAQSEGLGNHRINRHDLAFKKGTFPIVKEMFGEQEGA